MEDYRAITDFVGKDEKYLSFVKGDLLQVYKKDHNDWWMAKSVITGRVGRVPRNAIAQDQSPVMPAQSSSRPASSNASVEPLPKFCVATHNFVKQSKYQLSFQIGDKFNITGSLGEWWRVSGNGQEGIVPKNHFRTEHDAFSPATASNTLRKSQSSSGGSATPSSSTTQGAWLARSQTTAGPGDRQSGTGAVEVADWLHGPIRKNEAVLLLQSLPAGAFLVRSSFGKTGQYTLSVKIGKEDEVKHFKIEPLGAGFSLDSKTVFSTLKDLIDHYTKRPIDAEAGQLRFACPVRPTSVVVVEPAAAQVAMAHPTPAASTASRISTPPSATIEPPRAALQPPASNLYSRSAPSLEVVAPVEEKKLTLAEKLDLTARLGKAAEELKRERSQASLAGESTSPRPKSTTPTNPTNVSVTIHDSLLQAVKDSSGLSTVKAFGIIDLIARHLLQTMPNRSAELMAAFNHETLSASPGVLALHEYERQRLVVILQEIRDCKNDSQQRNWSIYDDSNIISEYLIELRGLLQRIDLALMSWEVVSADNFALTIAVLDYLHMETRSPLRLLLFQVLLAIGMLNVQIMATVFLESQLAIDLARDITSRLDLSVTENRSRLSNALILSNLMFSTGETVPVFLDQTWNDHLLDCVLEVLEEGDVDDDGLSARALAVLLSYNLHCPSDARKNPVLSLLKRSGGKVILERLLRVFNRNDEPTFQVNHQGPVSALRLLKDVCSFKETAALVYSNDANVLYDVILREIKDLPHRHPLRKDYLELLHLAFEHLGCEHRKAEFAEALRDCLNIEETDTSAVSREVKDIAQFILDQFC